MGYHCCPACDSRVGCEDPIVGKGVLLTFDALNRDRICKWLWQRHYYWMQGGWPARLSQRTFLYRSCLFDRLSTGMLEHGMPLAVHDRLVICVLLCVVRLSLSTDLFGSFGIIPVCLIGLVSIVQNEIPISPKTVG